MLNDVQKLLNLRRAAAYVLRVDVAMPCVQKNLTALSRWGCPVEVWVEQPLQKRGVYNS